MTDDTDHAAAVEAWLGRAAGDRSPVVLLPLFEAALGALWRRTKVTLGDVTLTAIVERVLYNAADSFPAFSSLKVGPNAEIEWREFRERAGALASAELTDGIRLALVEFLTVIGNLTAEILTPELHAELARVEGASRVLTDEERKRDEDTES